MLSQPTGMRLFRPGDSTLCAIHEDPTASIQLVAIPVVSTDGSYIPIAHHPPCSLADPIDPCQSNSARISHASQSHSASGGFDPISLDSDADSGRGGSVNNIGLPCHLEAPVCPANGSSTLTGTNSGTVHTLGVPVRYVSYTADGKIHMLSPPPNSCALGPQAVLVPISTVTDCATPALLTDGQMNTNLNDSFYPIPACTAHTVTSVVSTSSNTVLSTSTNSPSKRKDNTSGKKRDCGPWRLVQLPTQELEAEIQKY